MLTDVLTQTPIQAWKMQNFVLFCFLNYDMIVASQQDNKSNQTFGASPLSAWHPFETWHCEHFFFLSMQKA